MLEPNTTTRFTLKEVLSHPWMTGSCKVSSLPSEKKRQDVFNESVTSFGKELQNLNKCSCSCHDSNYSVLDKHCDDCREIQANDPEVMLRRNICLSSISSLSSGYGSEMGSDNLDNFFPLSMSNLNLAEHKIWNSEERHGSLSDKNYAGTIESNSAIGNKKIQHRWSVPVKTSMNQREENLEEDDEDIVFV